MYYFLTLPLLFILWIYLILIIKNSLITKTSSIKVNIVDQEVPENVTTTRKKIKYHVPRFMLELYEKNKIARKNEAEADLVRSLIPMQAAEEDHLLIFEIPNSAKDERFIGAELKILTQIETNQTIKLSIFDDVSDTYLFHSEILIKNPNNAQWLSFNLTQQLSDMFKSNQKILKMIITLYHQGNNSKLSLMPDKFDHNHNYPILLLSYAIEEVNVRHKRSIFEENYEEETNNIIWNNVKKFSKKTNYCRRRPLHINFSEINYDLWIVQPTSYEAYQCQGRCFYPVAEHLSPTKHAIMQSLIHSVNPLKASRSCCVPTVLDPISILYVDERGVLTYRFAYKDMVVVECGCR